MTQPAREDSTPEEARHPHGASRPFAHDTVHLFSTLCELDADERRIRLADIANENPELATLLADLLASASRTAGPTRALTNLASGLDPSQDPPPLAAGMKLGDFELVEPIGRGGMGEVWRARQENPRRDVAIKVLRTNARGLSLLAGLREREALAAIRHPGIATIHAAGEGAGYSWLAVELVEGARDIVTASQTLSLPQRIALIADVADAVAHAHASGFIHRDLKPSNVLVGRDGRPRIIDFGIAAIAATPASTMTAPTTPARTASQEASLHRTRDPLARLGTPAYLPPEAVCDVDAASPQRIGDARADVRALGVLLYQCVHRELPASLASENATLVLRALISTRFDPPPHAPRATRGDLAQVILRATATDPERRYRTMAAFAEDLRAHLASRPVQAAPRNTAGRLLLAMRRNPFAATVAIAAACLLVAATAISTWYANYARTAALDATALVQRTSETYGAFLDVFFPKEVDPREARELTLAELIRARISTLEERVARMATTDVVHGLDAPARMMQSTCLALGMPEDAQRCALVRAIVAAREGDPRGTQSSSRHFEAALAALAMDRTDPAALATIERLVPTILSERSILRAASLSSIGAVDYLADAALTERVADLVLQEDPEDPELALSAASRLALHVIRTIASGGPVDGHARTLLARANAIFREFAEGNDPAVADETILIANAVDLEFCRLNAVVRAPEMLTEFIECSLIAGISRPKSRTMADPRVAALGWSDTTPLRLLRAGHVELCRAFLAELDRRALILDVDDRRVVEWSRAELLLEDARELDGRARDAVLREAIAVLSLAAEARTSAGSRAAEEVAAICALLARCACDLGDFARARGAAYQLRQLAAEARSTGDGEHAEVYDRRADLIDGLIDVTSTHLPPIGGHLHGP
ncbi:MAG: serine/threonine protein kinase [Planctomycetaceae bacterium]|nr:serine/threonine protein kinase [Planctomycetaceae bacterium]